MHYAISMTDGSVAIMQTIGDASIAECIAKWPPYEQAKVIGYQVVDLRSIPTDRTFRNAWTLDGAAIAHDMDKARTIKRDRLRAERALRLAALDVDMLRAAEANDDKEKARITSAKRVLRDLPAHPAIDKAETADELRSLTLDVLLSL